MIHTYLCVRYPRRRACSARAAATMVLLCLSFANAVPVAASEGQEITVIKAVAYRNLSTVAFAWAVRGVAKELTPEDHTVLGVDVRFSLPEAENAVMIDGQDAALVDRTGRRISPLGSMGAGFSLKVNQLGGFVRDGEVMNWVFLVPEGARELRFELGEASAPLPQVEENDGRSDPADEVNVTVLGSQLVSSAASTNHYYLGGESLEVPSRLVNPTGMLLKVRLAVTPKRGNSGPSSFHLMTDAFGVLVRGVHAPVVAEQTERGARSQVNRTFGVSSEGEQRTEEVTLFFAVPEDTGSFTITYFAAPVAEGRVGT